MSRYIESEWLKRFFEADKGKGRITPIDTLLALIDDAPSIDIVRCSECKYNKNPCINHGEMSPRCRYANYKRSADDFCSYGEREGE